MKFLTKTNYALIMYTEVIINESSIMNPINHGIVLKRLTPSTHKFSVLTRDAGKITLVILNNQSIKQINMGTVIAFYILEQNNVMISTERVEIIVTPMPPQAVDIYWLHHLLELCYYFVPPGQPADDIFRFLLNCFSLLNYQQYCYDDWELVKHVCTAILINMVGFYPPDHLQNPIITLQKPLMMFVDFTGEQKVEFCRNSHQVLHVLSPVQLEAWLLKCIQSHPRINMFKTINFVYNTTSLGL